MAPQTRARDRLRQTATTTSREYHSSPIPQQVHFPARSRVVKTYGKRTPSRTALRQQTLTQIGFPLSMQQPETDGSELLEDTLETETPVPIMNKKKKNGRDSKRRKTMGDTPNPSSSFHTQTLTQFLSVGKDEDQDEDDKEDLLIKDSQDEDDYDDDDNNHGQINLDDIYDLPKDESPELTSERKPAMMATKPTKSVKGKVKAKARAKGGKAKTSFKEEAPPPRAASAVPQTPSTKGMMTKINIDEVPSSQPTPFTPMLDLDVRYSPIEEYRSPLKNKSTHTGTDTETISISKLPRNMVIQDSYSIGGGSSPFSIHQSPGPSPLRKTPMSIRSKPKRQPLAELPVPEEDESGMSQGEEQATPTKPRPGGSSVVKGSTSGGKKRAFVEIPDSDDDLESFGSSSPAMSRIMNTKTPTHQRVTAPPPPPDSAKENWTPTEKPHAGEVEGEENADEEMEMEGPGTPTPIARRSELRSREVPSSSAEDMDYESDEIPLSPVRSSSRQASRELGNSSQRGVVNEPTVDTTSRGDTSHIIRTPTTKRRVQIELPSMSDQDNASNDDDEEEEVLKETPHRKPAITKKPSPSSAAAAGRRKVVQIELPPPSTAKAAAAAAEKDQGQQVEKEDENEDEILKETPHRKTTRFAKISPRQVQQKSSPPAPVVQQRSQRSQRQHTQRQTQRSQLYSQGLESQRVPLEILNAMGPPTDTSDVFITIPAVHLEEIITGFRDHEFRPHVLPAVRAWFYATEPVNEVRYMATLGEPKKPGEIEGGSGVGNEEFNRGESYSCIPVLSGSGRVISSSGASFGGSGSGENSATTAQRNKFAHKLVQVYQLNNPVKKEELEEHGFGKGLPTKYRLLPPAAVGDLLANLRCALFAEEGDEENGEEEEENEGKLEAIEEGDEEDEDERMGEAVEEPGEEAETAESQPDQGVTVSQELEQQLRSDIIRSTQMILSESDDARLPSEGGGAALLRHDSTMASSSPQQRPPARERERVTSSGSKKTRTRDNQPPRMTVTKVPKKQQDVLVTTKKFQFAELEMEEDDEGLDLDKGGRKTPPPAARPARSRSTAASASTSVSASTSKPSTSRKTSGSRSASSQTTQTQTQRQTETRQTRRQSQQLTGSQHHQETQSQSQVNKITSKARQEKASMPPPPSPAKSRGGSSSKVTSSALAKLNKATATSTTRASTSVFGTGFSAGGHNNPNYNTARPSQATTASGPSSPIIPSRPDEEEVQEASLPQLSYTGQGQGRGVGTGLGRGRGRRPQSQSQSQPQLQLQHSESLTASASASASESSVIRPTVPDDGDDSHILLLSSSSIDVPEEGSITPTAAGTNRTGRRRSQTPGSGSGRGLGRLPLSSSQAIASLAPDSLLVDVEGVRAPPQLVVWDSEDEDQGNDQGREREREKDDDETASEDDGDLN